MAVFYTYSVGNAAIRLHDDGVARLDSPAAEAFFTALLDACGIERPDDWQARVRTGADPAQSGTARTNLTGVSLEFPTELGPRHRALVDYQAPGLRALLGYV